MILLLCAVKRGRSPFDTIKNKTKTEKPKPEQKCSPHQAGPGPGHWFCLPSVRASVCLYVEDATVATNASDDDAQHDPKQCTEQNQNEQQQEEEEEAEHQQQQQQQQNTLLILYTQNVPGPGQPAGRQAAMPRSMQLFAPFSQVAHFISKYNETKPNKTRNKTQKVKNQA